MEETNIVKPEISLKDYLLNLNTEINQLVFNLNTNKILR